MARSVRTFFDEPRNADLLDRLARAGVRMEQEPPAGSPAARRPSQGQTFVITGTLASMSREEATRRIDGTWGQSRRLGQPKDYVAGRGREAGSKLEKARTLGVPDLDEAGFLALIMKASG